MAQCTSGSVGIRRRRRRRRKKEEKEEKEEKASAYARRRLGDATRDPIRRGDGRRKATHPRTPIRARRWPAAGHRQGAAIRRARRQRGPGHRPLPASAARTSPTSRRSGRPGKDRWPYLAHVLPGVDGAASRPPGGSLQRTNTRSTWRLRRFGRFGRLRRFGRFGRFGYRLARYRRFSLSPFRARTPPWRAPSELAARRSRCARPTRRAGASLPAPRRRGRGGTRASPAGGRPAG